MAKAQNVLRHRKLRPEQIIKPSWDLADEAKRIARQYADGPAAGSGEPSISLEGPLNVHTVESAFKVLQTYSLVQWKREQEIFDTQAGACGRTLCFCGE
jgi:hypothetical protein